VPFLQTLFEEIILQTLFEEILFWYGHFVPAISILPASRATCNDQTTKLHLHEREIFA